MSVIYFDNAATTPLRPAVLEAMLPYFVQQYGNPSSIHSFGRNARLAVEESRKKVASLLGAQPKEIFFTSCGTESSNTILNTLSHGKKIKHFITSAIEHPATLNTLKKNEKDYGIKLSYVSLLEKGEIDLSHLEVIFKASNEKKCLSLMHANNEIGNLLSIKYVAELCKKYDVLFHSDMVQTVGHYPINLNELKVDFISASGHKFHGPKGIGILYIQSENAIKPMITGGGQERNMRAGTENVANIVGIAKALEISLNNYEKESAYIKDLKNECWNKLKENFGDMLSLNGSETGLYTVLNVSFPLNPKTEMLQQLLDIEGFCVSGGSACSSGASVGSHVISAIRNDANAPLRLSFAHYNTKAEIEKLIATLRKILN